jgi:hypothetical protein
VEISSSIFRSRSSHFFTVLNGLVNLMSSLSKAPMGIAGSLICELQGLTDVIEHILHRPAK